MKHQVIYKVVRPGYDVERKRRQLGLCLILVVVFAWGLGDSRGPNALWPAGGVPG